MTVPASTYKHPNILGAGAEKRKGLSPKDKFDAVMHEFGLGTLHSSDGKIVKDRNQAIAIAYSESEKVKKMIENEKCKTMQKAGDIEKKVIEYLTKNPKPRDETQFHKFAETVAKEHDVAEEEVYNILGSFLSGGKSKGQKKPVDPAELKAGIKVETEHTADKNLTEKIARDHLSEFPDYYTELKKFEAGLKTKPLKKAFIHLFDNLFVRMDKADRQGPHKYIRRVPKATGKGYNYFYTREQWEHYKKTGKVPEQKGEGEEKSGGILSGIMSFFGFKDEKQAQEKVKETYEKHKSELAGMEIKTFSDYMNEYCANKEKWDKRFKQEKIYTKDTKTGEVKKQLSSDKKTTVPSGKKTWNLNLMKKIAGFVGTPKGGEKKEPTKDNFENMPEGEKGFKPRLVVDHDFGNKEQRDLAAKKLKEAKIKFEISSIKSITIDHDNLNEGTQKVVDSIQKELGANIINKMGSGYEGSNKRFKEYSDSIGDKTTVMQDKVGFDPNAPEKFSKDYEKYAEGVKSDIKKNNSLADYYLEHLQKDIKQSYQRIKSIKKQAQGTGEDFTGATSGFEERIKDASILSKQIKEITGEYPSDAKTPLAEAADKLNDALPGKGKEENFENLSSVKKYIDTIMSDYKNQAEKAKSEGVPQERIDSALADREKDTINYVNNLEKWIKDKDYKQLNDILHTRNNHSRKMFEEATGISLGKTDKSMRDALKKFVGDENFKKVEEENLKVQKEKDDREKSDRERKEQEQYGHLGDYAKTLTPKEKGLASKFLKEKFIWGNTGLRSRQEQIDKLIKEGWGLESDKYSGYSFQAKNGDFNKELNKPTAIDYVKHELQKQGKFKETEEHSLNKEYSKLYQKKQNLEKQIDKMDQGMMTYSGDQNKIREKRKEIIDIENKLKALDEKSKPLTKAAALLLSELKKAKELPVGSTSPDGKRRKAADGTWKPITGGKKEKPEDEKKKDVKPEEKPEEKKQSADKSENREKIKTALKKFATILSEALSGKDAIQPTGAAIEQVGDNVDKNKKKQHPVN